MFIRTFRAASLQEALDQIREEMGPDASVLHTRQVRDGWRGWLGQTFVEVTAGSKGFTPGQAAAGSSTSSVSSSTGKSDGKSDGESSAIASAPTESGSNRLQEEPSTTASVPFLSASRIRSASATLPTRLLGYREQLLKIGVREETVDRWMTSATGFAAATGNTSDDPYSIMPWIDHLRQAVARELRIGSPIRTQPGDRRIVALVGPTGVGKTTTVAKLAAGFRIEARRRVGLLTIDTFRIAAVDQLRAYAEIMDLPMEVVQHQEEMSPALDKLGDVDLVLIDTAGRSPRSDARIEQLVSFLRAAQPDETLLVVSGTSSVASIETTMRGFAPVNPTSAVLTKVDETPHLAGALSALIDGSAPPEKHHRGYGSPSNGGGMALSYITTGQQVPDDIEVANANRLTERLVPPPIHPLEAEAA